MDPKPSRSPWLSGILSVHPPVAERVRLLVRMSPGASLEKLEEAAQTGTRFADMAGLPPEEPAAPAVSRLVAQPQTMLAHIAQPSGLPQEFTISEGETLLTELEITPSQYTAAWTLDLERWEVYCDSGGLGLTREYYLEGNGELKGRAHKEGILSATHVVDFSGQTYTLEKESVFLHQFTLRQEGRSLGAIYPELPVKMTAVAELPVAMPVPLKIFLISLALLWWSVQKA